MTENKIIAGMREAVSHAKANAGTHMTDQTAPERIWTRGRDGETKVGLFVTVPATHGYVREDLFAAQQAVIDELVEALQFAKNVFDTPISRRKISGEYATDCRYTMRAALAKAKETGT